MDQSKSIGNWVFFLSFIFYVLQDDYTLHGACASVLPHGVSCMTCVDGGIEALFDTSHVRFGFSWVLK